MKPPRREEFKLDDWMFSYRKFIRIPKELSEYSIEEIMNLPSIAAQKFPELVVVQTGVFLQVSLLAELRKEGLLHGS